MSATMLGALYTTAEAFLTSLQNFSRAFKIFWKPSQIFLNSKKN
jgi:hypothetical protein